LVFENMDKNPPGEEVLNRLTPTEWVGRSLYADQAALERSLLSVETPLTSALKDALRTEPDIKDAGRLLFLALPADATEAQTSKLFTSYAACLSYFRHFCRQPLFLDARLLAEKMLSRQPIDNDDVVAQSLRGKDLAWTLARLEENNLKANPTWVDRNLGMQRMAAGNVLRGHYKNKGFLMIEGAMLGEPKPEPKTEPAPEAPASEHPGEEQAAA